MISDLLMMWLSGGLIGFGLAVQWSKIAKIRADERLVERNEHLEAEVTRLRAQVALHINPSRPEEYRADLHSSAVAAASL